MGLAMTQGCGSDADASQSSLDDMHDLLTSSEKEGSVRVGAEDDVEGDDKHPPEARHDVMFAKFVVCCRFF